MIATDRRNRAEALGCHRGVHLRKRPSRATAWSSTHDVSNLYVATKHSSAYVCNSGPQSSGGAPDQRGSLFDLLTSIRIARLMNMGARDVLTSDSLIWRRPGLIVGPANFIISFL